ncbi:MAG: M14 family metallocarboxypeptidase [Opitutales bacterium]
MAYKGPQRSHNYKFLLQRWRSLCRASGMRMQKVAELDGFPCYEVVSPAIFEQPTIYLSAGIHGDEAGSTEGLLRWAESRQKQLSSLPLLIYPCLNPWGLENNSRLDAHGIDLNRIWYHAQNPLVTRIKEQIDKIRLSLVLTLHEDFDGQGVYLYEPSANGRSNGRAEGIIQSSQPWIQPDPRRMIDGRRARNGIIRPRPTNPPEDGIPEALYFYRRHKCPTFTFETPSEFDLNLRIEAQSAMIQRAVTSIQE